MTKVKKIKKTEPITEKVISYDIINKSFSNGYDVDIINTNNDEQIIKLLKEKGVLKENSSNDNIEVIKKGSVIFINDLEKKSPIIELHEKEYVKKEDGGEVVISDFINQEYFKQTIPTQPIVAEVIPTEVAAIADNVVIDNQVQQVVEDTNVVKTEVNPSGDLILPDYDNVINQESVLSKHIVNGEIYITHLVQILKRKLKYEEQVGNVKLRKCFARDYYKVI